MPAPEIHDPATSDALLYGHDPAERIVAAYPSRLTAALGRV